MLKFLFVLATTAILMSSCEQESLIHSDITANTRASSYYQATLVLSDNTQITTSGTKFSASPMTASTFKFIKNPGASQQVYTVKSASVVSSASKLKVKLYNPLLTTYLLQNQISITPNTEANLTSTTLPVNISTTSSTSIFGDETDGF